MSTLYLLFYKTIARTHIEATPGMPRKAIRRPEAMFIGTYMPKNPAAIFIANNTRNANAIRNQ